MSAIIATVTAVKGEVFVRLANGTLKHLHQGDAIHEGEQVVTSTGANVELAYQDGRQVQIAEQHTLTVDAAVAALDKPDSNESAFFADTSDADKVLAALERGDDLSTLLEAPAAGLSAGGGDDGGSGFVRLLRIVEGVDPLSFAFTAAAATPEEQVTTAATDELNGELTAVADSTQLLESAAATTQSGNLINNDLFPSNRSVVVSQIDGTSFNGQITLAGNYGSLAVAADGSYTYTLDPAKAASLVNDQQVNEVFNYTLSNGIQTSNANLTVNITGINNIAVVNTSSTTQGSVTEDNPAAASGTVIMTDADAGQNGVIAETINDAYGTFSVNSSGQWSYTLDSSLSDVQGLKAGETLVREFTVTSTDGGTTQVVTVEIHGSNDAPLTTDYTATTLEDTSVSGQIIGTDVDGGSLSYSKGSDPAHGSVTVNADGTWNYSPAANFYGKDSFTVTIADTQGGTTSSTISVTVNPVNDAPVTSNYTSTTPEDTSVTGQVVGSDVDGGSLSYSKGSDPAHGSVTVNADGTWNYSPAANFYGKDSFTVTIADTQGGTTSSTISVTVNPVNDAPVTSNYTSTTPEDTSVTGQVVGSDVDGGSLSYSKGTDPAHGTVTVNADGTWNYSPAANFYGKDPLTVTIADTQGGTTTSTIYVTVDPVNDDPVATDYTTTTLEDTSVTGQVVGSDVDGGSLSYSKGTDPAHGTVTVNADGTWNYSPAANFYGKDSFTVTIADTQGGTTTSTIYVTVDPVNDDPVATDYTTTTLEDTSVTGQVVGSDVDGGSLSYSKGTDPAHGTVTVNADGTWNYSPAANFYGKDSFTVTIADTQGGTTTSTIYVTVDPVNDDPVATDYTTTTLEDTSVTGQVVGSDVDGGSLSYSKGTDPAHGTVTVNADGTWNYSPAANFYGKDSFTVTIADTQGGTTTSTIYVTVDPVNDDPVATDYTTTTLEDTSVTGQVVGSDVDGGSLSYSKGTDPAHGTVTVNADGTWNYSPAANFYGKDSFTVTIADTQGGTTTSTIYVTVDPVNDDPVATDYTTTTLEDTSVTGQVVGSDVDGGSLSYSKGTDPAHGTVTVNADGTWNYSPAANFYGKDSFTVTIADTQGGTTTSTIYVTVDPVNDDPVATDYTTTTLEDTSVTGQVVGSDVDGGSLSYFKGTDPAHGTVTVNADGTWNYSPAANFYGKDSFTVTIADTQGGTTTSTIYVTVDPVNDDPVAAIDSGLLTTKDTPLSITVSQLLGNDSDPDDDPISIKSVQSANHGTVALTPAGNIVFTPDPTYTGPASFTYTIQDVNGATSTTRAELTINPMPVITLSSTTNTITGTNFGLSGEYFGYNDNRSGTLSDPSYSGNLRQHSDDGTADAGAANNLDVIADIENLVEGRNSDTSLVGSARVSQTNAADATFSANKMEFGLQPGTLTTLFSNGLGTNNKVTSGNTVGSGNNLNTFVKVSSGNADSLVATSGVGSTTDAAIRMVGYINIPAGGLYDIRVSADDGFRILIGGQNVAEVNANQAPRTTTHNGVTLSEGLQSIEILYWDQGGQASFRVEVKESGAPTSSYKIIGNEEFALFSPSEGRALSNSLSNTQDIVETSTNGEWAVRTSTPFTGSSASEQINGSDGRDAIHGGAGNDIIQAGAGSDLIHGGAGNDIIQAGAGSDLIHGGVGNDTMTGGQGSDTFMWELADKGSTTLPNKDVISDFNTASKAVGGDVLDLRDLLQDESQTPGNLGNYLHFEKVGSDTIVHVSSTGGYSGGFNTSHDDLQITLSSVDLTASNTLSDATILQQLISQGKLISD